MIQFYSDIEISEEDKQFILKCLPSEWKTEIKYVNPSQDMEVHLKINAKTVEEINSWVAAFQNLTNTTYSVHNTRKCLGERLTFKKLYKCHHNTRRKDTYDPVHRKRVKNTKCPSMLLVNIRVVGKRYRGKNQKDAPDPDKPCEIKVKLNHNHSLTDEMATKFKRVLPEIRNKLIKLYKQGHTPSTALTRLKSDIRMNYENYAEILADRSKCPDYRYCHYIYERCISKSQDSVVLNEEFLENKLENYNTAMNDLCAKMAISDSGYVICFCPPFVKRIHQFGTSSSTVVFIYPVNICDKKGTKIYILLTHSEISALPLGVIISTSNCSNVIFTGFSLLKEMLGDMAFGGNILGPEFIVIDEFLNEENIFNTLWPQSNILLCMSFVLHDVWRWLSSGKNHIEPDDKLLLFTDFHNMIYSESEDDFMLKYHQAKSNASKYENYQGFLNNYFEKRTQWALCYRSNVILRENCNTKQYSETILRIMKSKSLERLKSFNIFQLVDFIINNFFLFFEHRLIDAANTGVIDSILQDKIQMPPIDILQRIKILGSSIQLVPSEKTKELIYVVNTDMLTCTCFNGYSGTLCKHVQWMCLLVHSDIFCNKKIDIAEIRNNYYQLTNGNISTNDTIIINEDDSKNLIEINDATEINEQQNLMELFRLKNDVFFEDAVIVELESDENIIEESEDSKLIREGKEIWQQMTKIYEDFLKSSPEQVVAVSRNMISKCEKFKTVSEFCSACNLFGSKKHYKISTDYQPSHREVDAATKLLLLSSNTNSNIVLNSAIEKSPIIEEENITNQIIPIQQNQPDLKSIVFLSRDMNYILSPANKKIKLVPLQNNIILDNAT